MKDHKEAAKHYFKKVHQQLGFSELADYGGFVAEREQMLSLYSLRYQIRCEHNGYPPDTGYERTLEALRCYNDEKVFVFYIIENSSFVLCFLNLDGTVLIGEISSPASPGESKY